METMKDFYNPKNIGNYKYDFGSNFVASEQRNEFHIGQSYEEKTCETLYCKHCGSDKFKVGQADYFTALKCTTCEYEICIHDG